MNWLWNIAGYLSDLAAERPWTSWIMHALIAVPITLGFGGAAAFAVFAFREGEQMLHRKIHGVALDRMDHFMDVFAPTAAAAVVELLLKR